MNFEKLLAEKKLQDARKASTGKALRFVMLVGVLGIIGFTGYWLMNSDLNVESPEQPPSVAIDSVSLEEETMITEKEPLKNEEVRKEIKPARPSPSQEVAKDQPKTNPAPSDTASQEPFNYFEAEPENGYPHLYEYFANELKYPEIAMRDSISGIVTVSFVLNRNGKPEQIKVLNSMGEAFDLEAFRIIENMPSWKPATLNGNPVSSKISVPLSFQFKKDKVKP